MKRRTFLAGGAALALGGAYLVRPEDSGVPHNNFFTALNDTLKTKGPMKPAMIVDLDALDHNIDVTAADCAAMGKDFRIVAKSIPSQGLVDYVAKRAQTKRLMAFHYPFLVQHTKAFPDSDILLGKPMPVQSAKRTYELLAGSFNPQRQLQWLIDTPQRLAQYLALAQALNTKMRINIELDVGLHRGGVTAGDDLKLMLDTIKLNPSYLVFAGFMGYDPHVVKVPSLLGTPEELVAKVMDVYQAAVDQVKEGYPALWANGKAADGLGLTLNTAGSPSYALHKDEQLSTELAIGSALVKATDFDIDTLAEHRPAAWIATPVLKALDGVEIPGLDGKSKVLSWWDINQRKTYFTYGGYWKAKPDSPVGLANNGLYGRSTNQEMLNGSPATALNVDDQIFLRPTQSEFVFLQFGDLIAVRGGEIVDTWPVFGERV